MSGSLRARLAVGTAVALTGALAVLAWSDDLAAPATLAVTPLTWEVIGLNSNQPDTGPREFPVGARVCLSEADASDVVATLNLGGERRRHRVGHDGGPRPGCGRQLRGRLLHRDGVDRPVGVRHDDALHDLGRQRWRDRVDAG